MTDGTMGLSAADVAAVTRNNDDDWGGGCWWIWIILLAFLFPMMGGWNRGGSRRDRAYAETERRSGWRNRDGLYRSYGEHLSECERGHADPCTGRNKPYCISRKYFYNRSPGKRREPHHQKSCVGGDES